MRDNPDAVQFVSRRSGWGDPRPVVNAGLQNDVSKIRFFANHALSRR